VTSRIKFKRVPIVIGAVVASVTFGLWTAFAAVAGTATLDKTRYHAGEHPVPTVTDADLNSDPGALDTVSVNLKSTTDASGIGVVLRESGNNTGVFNTPVPAINFTTGASNDATNTLQVSAGDTVTLTYTDAAPAGDRTATATMYVDTGAADLDQDSYALDDTATLTVTDVDLNLNPALAESVAVNLASTSDATGITVNLVETGPNTATFTDTATFSIVASNDGNDVLLVAVGDTVTLTFAERLFDGTQAGRTDVALIADRGEPTFNAERYDVTDTATLQVADGDADTSALPDTLDVALFSATDGTGIMVTLTETGLTTGEFSGSATFTTGASNDATNTLQVAAGDIVTLSYDDDAPVETVTATARMFADTATAAFDKTRFRVFETATLTVVDADANLDSQLQEGLSVSVTSTTDGSGISVDLSETGNATGIFTGTMTFSATLTVDLLDQLEAAQGDTVTVSYAEPVFAGGTSATTDTATMFVDSATAMLDAAGYAVDDIVGFSIADVDRDLDPAAADSFSVNLRSDVDVVGINVDVTETGNATGIFEGDATLKSTGTSDDAGDVLRVDPGGVVTLTYNEPVYASNTTTARTDTADVFSNGTLALDAQLYSLPDTATFTVTDPDLDTSGTPDTVDVHFESTTDPGSIDVTLTETGNATGVFTGTATFTDTGPSDDVNDVLHIASGDTVTATYAETTTFSGTDADRVATAGIVVDDGTASLDERRYRLLQTATLTVEDSDENLSATTPDVVTATLDSTTDPTGISVDLTETGNATGVFTGTATFTTAASNDNTDLLSVAQGDTITLTYLEKVFAGGTAERTDTAKMYTNDATAALDATVYSLDGTATITVTDGDRNLDVDVAETVTVTLTSTSDGTGISVVLTETGVSTGIFSGAATFSDTASDDTADVLRVAAGGTITLTYAEPAFAGGTTNRTDTATMAVNGTASLTAEHYALADTATLRVTDADLNTSTVSTQTVDVNFASTSDPVGITVTLTEASVNSSQFDGSATFNIVASDDGTDSLLVAAGDTVTITYAETTTFDGPDADRTDTATMFANTATADLDESRYSVASTPVLTVADADRNVSPTVQETFSVNLKSTSDAAGISVTLTETGVNTGLFSGGATFNTTASNDVTDSLLVGTADLVTLTYAEPLFAGGTADRTDIATMNVNGSASLDDTVYSVSDTVTMTVSDADENQTGGVESVDVTLSSDTDPGTINVTLMETGGSTGTFTGTATLTTGPSDDDNDILQVSSGDTITLAYAETTTFSGTPANRTDTARMVADASVFFDQPTYAAVDTATLTVDDPDENTDAGSAQSVAVELISDSDGTGINVTLTESGNDTGVFEGTATFTAGASDDGNDILKAASGDLLTLSFDETTTFDGTPATRTANAKMNTDGTVSLDAEFYQLDTPATATVVDPDLNLDAGAAETVDVGFISSTDGAGITFTLTETGADTGTFVGSAGFVDGPSDDGADLLAVSQGDGVLVSYEETTTFDGTPDTLVDLASMRRNGSAAFNVQRFALSDAATLTVADEDIDTDGGSMQDLDVTVVSGSDPVGIGVTLVETGNNTGIFSGTITFTTGASDDGTDTLEVSGGDALGFDYLETTTFDGPDATRTGEASMYSDDATVFFERAHYAVDETATLSVADTDANLDPGVAETVDVAVTSTSDGTGISATLTETGADTGLFAGPIDFSENASDDGADVIRADSGDTVTASYTEALFAGGNADRTGTTTMNLDGATATFDQTSYAMPDTATLTVTDVDGDADPATADAVSVALVSSTDGTGITVELTETGASTGAFTGAATFSTDPSDDVNDVLQVAGGDDLTLTYAEHLYDGTDADRTDTATVNVDGTIDLNADVFGLDDTVGIVVTDADLNTDGGTQQTVDVELASTTDSGTISVQLTETGNDTGVFTGTATLTTGPTDDDADALQVSEGDTLTATYAETTTEDGTPADRTDTASVGTNGTVALDATRYALADTATIAVADPDLDTDAGSAQSVVVALTSTTDGTGISVTLDETAVDSGVFEATATFTTGASDDGADVLGVAAGDDVTATYGETTTFEGPGADRTDGATMLVDTATATLDAAAYGVGSVPAMTVVDVDANADPSAEDTVSVELSSTSDPGTINVQLAETGNDTGTFTGTATFSTGASDDANDVLQIAPGDEVTLRYVESLFAGGTADRTDTAAIGFNGVVALDAARYATTSPVAITVVDPDENGDAGTAESVAVTLDSTTDATGIEVTLTESGVDTGVFEGSATLTEGASDDGGDLLSVAAGDTVTATFADSPTFDGPDADRTDSAGVDPTLTSASPDDRGRGATDQDVTLAGTGLNAGAGVAFSGGGITVDSVDVTGSTSAVVTIDIAENADPSARDVTLTNTNGGLAVCAACFTVNNTLETLSVSPGALAQGVQDVLVTVTGAGFDAGSQVSFGGGEVTVDSTTFVNATTLRAVIDVAPGATVGDVDVKVTKTDAGANTCAGCFTIRAAPVEMDFNGDGFTDLASGVPGDAFGAGGVSVLYGSAAGVTAAGDQVWTQGSSGVPGGPRAGDGFGAALAGGDFDGDGYGDLAIGVPGEKVSGKDGAGAVNVLYGSAAGLTAGGSQLWTQQSGGVKGSAAKNENFGAALAAGDFDGDGFLDLAIGAPGDGAARGAVHVLYGWKDGLRSTNDDYWRQGRNGIAGGRERGDRFGSALAAGDFDGDGFFDLAAGAPNEDVGGRRDMGAFNVIPGSSGGLTGSGDKFFHRRQGGVAGAGVAGDRFGFSLAAGDFDGNGRDDVAAGVPGAGTGGEVNVFYGTGSGLSRSGDQRWHQNRGGIAESRERDDLFGFSLAAGDFDGDGSADLAIGVPGESIGSKSAAGGVHVLFGGGKLAAAGSQFWSQQSAGVRDRSERGDLFGFALAARDFDGDGSADLAIGVPGESHSSTSSAGQVQVFYGGAGGPTAAGDQLWRQGASGVLGAAGPSDGMGAAL